MSVDTAIIMAAGLGSRIPAFSRNAPKGFLPISGVPIVERSIAILAEHGIFRIVIGTGYRAEDYGALADRLGRHGIQIDCVHNEDFARSGSLETFLRCTTVVDGNFLSLESDLLYHPDIVARALACPSSNVIMASGQTRSGDEVYIETDDAGHLVALSKNAAALARIDAELVGICKLDASIPRALEAWIAAQGRSRPVDLHYEEGLAGIAGAIPLHVETTDLPWTEIDTPEHLDRATRMIWPRIAERERVPA